MREIATIAAGLITVILACACSPRPAGRDVCYAAADTDALARYVRECDGYASTSECPAAQAIEADHQKAQEACP